MKSRPIPEQTRIDKHIKPRRKQEKYSHTKGSHGQLQNRPRSTLPIYDCNTVLQATHRRHNHKQNTYTTQ